MQIQFKSESIGSNGDTFGIRVYQDGAPGPWVQWCDRVSRRCVVSHGIYGPDGLTPVGWAAAKSQAEEGAKQLQHLYDIGEIE